jgi:glucose-6-phosphate isomerase
MTLPLPGTSETTNLRPFRESLEKQIADVGKARSLVEKEIRILGELDFADRLWKKDASLWKKNPSDQTIIKNSLGWLTVAEKMMGSVDGLHQVVREVHDAGFRHVVHMGMGGSSLAPLAFAHILPKTGTRLDVTVLDTTNPATISDLQSTLPLADTLFIVASKSGSTAEVSAFCEYFYREVEKIKGGRAGDNFIAITDPGSSLETLASRRNFRRLFRNFSDIGGRYSALSFFGLVPAALMGVDIRQFLERALQMQYACSANVPAHDNPGLVLGAILGAMAKAGRNKVTFLAPSSLNTLGLWLEQLIAESTGKEGKGILPVACELPVDPSSNGRDRLFFEFQLKAEPDVELQNAVAQLRASGQPVVTIFLDDRMDLAQEIFRWEVATAVSGKIIGINPFDQPNVKESKDNTNRLLEIVRTTGVLPADKPDLAEPPLSLYSAPKAASISLSLRKFLQKAKPGDYVALLAYLPEIAGTERALQDLRLHLRKQFKLATTLGFGPRYLHSTGQFHKGGPNTGIFLLLTADDPQEVDIPGSPFPFGTLLRAQATGDLQALRQHGRRVVRIHVGQDVRTGIELLHTEILTALANPIAIARKKTAARKPAKKSTSLKRPKAAKTSVQRVAASKNSKTRRVSVPAKKSGSQRTSGARKIVVIPARKVNAPKRKK